MQKDKIVIAYDRQPSQIQQTQFGEYYNNISNKFYCINGFNRLDRDIAKFVLANRGLVELDHLYTANGVAVDHLLLKDAIDSQQFFIYEIFLKPYRLASYSVEASRAIINQLIPKTLVNCINSDQCHLILNTSIHSTNLDDFNNKKPLLNLLQALQANGINTNKCTIISNGQRVTVSKKINILYWDVQETQLQEFLKNKTPIDYASKIANFSGKRFLCINKKQRAHRYYFVYQLFNKSYYDKISYSLDKLDTSAFISNLNCPFWKKLKEPKHSGKFNLFLQSLPLQCEYKTELTPYQKSIWLNEDIDAKMFLNTGIHLNTETRVNEDANYILSEKTYKDIAAKMPFIICGPRYGLKHLQSLGFKTFNSLWSEEYDNIDDPIERVNTVVKLVDSLFTLTDSEFIDLLRRAEPIVEYNYQKFISRTPTPYLKTLMRATE